MTEKIITHEDLPHIAAIEKMMDRGGPGIPVGQWNDLIDFVKHLRITAEADAPPLPEGWVLLTRHDGTSRVLWHYDGDLYLKDDRTRMFTTDPALFRDRCTPLRPTITEADRRAAIHAAEAAFAAAPDWFDAFERVTDAVLKAAGIEVSES